jgi:diguanylate cyclase (GGDEF)-like protein
MDSLNRLRTSDHASSPDQNRELEFGKSFSSARSVKEVLDIVMYQIGRIFKPRHWSILLKNPKSRDLVFSIVIGENRQTLQGRTLAKGKGIAGHIMETGRPLVVKDVSKEPRFSSWADKFTGFQTRSVIGAPLKTGDKIFGVIELINRMEETPFTRKDLALFTSIAEYAAIAIERSYYTQNLTRLATRDSLTGLMNRWSFQRALGRKNEFRIRYGDPFSMLIIRMEGLDRLIRSGGQPAWEEAVTTLVRILQTAKRKNDSLFRYSDIIFLLLLPQIGSAGAKTCRHRIEQAIQTAAWKDPQVPRDIHMGHHTLSSDKIETLIPLLGEALPGSRNPPVSQAIPDIRETLQPLVAQETPEEPVQEKVSKKFGKAVSLRGHASTTKTRVSIKVARISMTAIGFRAAKPGMISPGDLLDVQFVLDDLKRSVIKRQIRVLEVDETYVYGTFYNPPPYDKDLGFYVLS